MNIKLTNGTRDQIIRAAIDFTFGKRAAALKKGTNELAVKVLHHFIGEEHLRLYKKSPPGWLYQIEEIFFRLRGQLTRLSFDKPMQAPMYVVSSSNNVIEVNTPLGEEIVAHLEALACIKTEREQLTAEIKALVYSVATANRLEEIWPEGKRFIPEPTKQAVAQLPAIVIANLNEKIKAYSKVA